MALGVHSLSRLSISRSVESSSGSSPRAVPFWLLVLPQTLLSASLILFKSRRGAQGRCAAGHSELGTLPPSGPLPPMQS